MQWLSTKGIYMEFQRLMNCYSGSASTRFMVFMVWGCCVFIFLGVQAGRRIL